MQPRTKGALSLALVFTLGSSGALAAPPGDERTDPKRPATGLGSGTTDIVEGDWRIAPDIARIEGHMDSLAGLSDSLGSASQDLQKDFEKFLDEPGNELVASRLEKKMAIFADQVIQDFDRVLEEQDLIIANFKELRRKLGRFDDAIGTKLDDYDRTLKGVRAEVDQTEKELIALAIKIKETQDPQAKRALRNEFTGIYRRFRLKTRNVRIRERNLHNFQVLVQNLQTLTDLFGQLQDKFVALIENLDEEKKALLEAIDLQRDAVKIKKIMADGIVHGERSIKNVTERLARIYNGVTAYANVYERINMGLSQYGETRGALNELSTRIDDIGTGMFGAGDPKSIEDAVEHFAAQQEKLTAEERRELREELIREKERQP